MEHLYTDCMCPVPKVGELDLMWMQDTVFLMVLAAITLVGARAGDGVARAGTGCEEGLPFCSVAVTALSGAWSDPKLLKQKPCGSCLSWLCSLSVCFSLSLHSDLCPRGGSAGGSGACVHTKV